jgi:hypothetical protein
VYGHPLHQPSHRGSRDLTFQEKLKAYFELGKTISTASSTATMLESHASRFTDAIAGLTALKYNVETMIDYNIARQLEETIEILESCVISIGAIAEEIMPREYRQ